jgi:tripeptidyl-peptidase-1
MDKLESMLEAVSTPGNAKYGQYMDIDQQNAIFAPSASSQDQVKSWLESNDITSYMSDGSLVTFTTTVSKANALLNTTFAYYTNGATTKLRTMEYSIPDTLASALDFVAPTTFFGNTKSQRVVSQAATAPEAMQKRVDISTSCLKQVEYEGESYELFTPQCYKESFNISDYKVDPSAGSTIAFGSFLNESASYSDLALFEKAFDIPSQNFTVTIIQNGATYNLNDQDPDTESDGEANLDVQNIVGIVDGLPVSEYVTPTMENAIVGLSRSFAAHLSHQARSCLREAQSFWRAT